MSRILHTLILFALVGTVFTSGAVAEPPVTAVGIASAGPIDLPNGFEYTLAEMGSSTFRTEGPVNISATDSYAQFAHIHLNNHGVVKNAA